MYNRIRILNDQEFKVVGLDNLKFAVGYYRCSDHRFHGVDIMLNNNNYNNHLFEYTTDIFVNKFDIHPDDAQWLRNKIVNMNKIEDERVEIEDIEFSVFRNAREYSIAIRYNEKELKTEFYSILDVVFGWAAQKIIDNIENPTKLIAFYALKRLAKTYNVNPKIETEEAKLQTEAQETEEPFMY